MMQAKRAHNFKVLIFGDKLTLVQIIRSSQKARLKISIYKRKLENGQNWTILDKEINRSVKILARFARKFF